MHFRRCDCDELYADSTFRTERSKQNTYVHVFYITPDLTLLPREKIKKKKEIRKGERTIQGAKLSTSLGSKDKICCLEKMVLIEMDSGGKTWTKKRSRHCHGDLPNILVALPLKIFKSSTF